MSGRGRYPPPGMLGPRAIARWALSARSDGVRVEGLEHVPRDGPVLIVARHYHHLLDGAVLIHHLARPVHIVVGLDWTLGTRQRRWMERACALAGWPVILRPKTSGGHEAGELSRYLRRGLRDAAALLREGRLVVIFPEGYPVVDPRGEPPATRDVGGFLPFGRGYRTIARLAGRAVPLVPLGFRYEGAGARWRIIARFGAPLAPDALPAHVESAVRSLC